MKVVSNIKCSKIQKLMSPYIDSMAEPEEIELLDSHLETCVACRRQLQSYISLRSMMARVEPVRPPEDLVLDTRVRLSHARSGGWFDRIESLLVNVLKPVAFPAVSAIVLTVLSFSVLFGQVALNPRLQSLDTPILILEEPVRITDQTVLSAPGSNGNEMGEPLSVQANVGVEGRVYGIKIIGGSKSPAATRWINNLLYPAQFAPATNRLGKPVNSTIILAFVNVQS